MRWCSRCCTGRPARTARCARCWPCSACRSSGSIGSACRVAFDKSIATTVVADAGIRTPAQVALPHEIFRELGAQALVAALGEQIGFPMMVKPSRSGSALGCSKVTRAEELPSAMVGRVRVRSGRGGRGVHRRHRGHGRGGRPRYRARPRCPRWRSGPTPGVYDYTARYTAGATRFLCPAEVTDAGRRALRRAGAAGARRARACATCPGPTSSSPRTASRSSSRSTSRRG